MESRCISAVICNGGHSHLVVFRLLSRRGFNVIELVRGGVLGQLYSTLGVRSVVIWLYDFLETCWLGPCLMIHMRTIHNATAQDGGTRPKFF